MDRAVEVDDRFTVAQFAPKEGDFRHFAEAGFRSVVNMKTDAEKQELTPEDEGRLAEEAGLAYLHHPVVGDALSEDVVDRFREKVATLPGPVLVHCASGKRSGALLLMHLGAERGMTGEEAVQQAADLGLVREAPEMEQFMKEYVDGRTGS